MTVSWGSPNRSAASGRMRPIGEALGWICGKPPCVDPRLRDPLRRPVAGRHVVGGPGAGIAPVDDRETAEAERVELVPVHEPASPGGHVGIGLAPPERSVHRVHPARDMPGQAKPIFRRATGSGHRGDVVAPRVRGHQASAQRGAVGGDGEDLAARRAERDGDRRVALQRGIGRHRAQRVVERGARLDDVDLAVSRFGVVGGDRPSSLGQRRPVERVRPDLDRSRSKVDPDQAHLRPLLQLAAGCSTGGGRGGFANRSEMFAKWEQKADSLTRHRAAS